VIRDSVDLVVFDPEDGFGAILIFDHGGHIDDEPMKEDIE
jgi:hypothetical protein